MGLFTNRCANPDCRHRVRKGSQFCPKCGEGSPKGLRLCSACRAEVSAQSKFCFRCGGDMSEMAKPLVLGDSWSRRADDFAVRVDVQDIKGRLSKPLAIEHGTRAMLFQGGKFKGELDEGTYNMGGFLKRLNHFMVDQASSVVLMDAGDVTVDLENTDLWSADKIEVAAKSRLVLRIDDPDAMFLNLFKGVTRLGLDTIKGELEDEIHMLLGGIVAQHPAEQLFRDVEIRNELETALRETLTVTLSRAGLELVQMRFVNFVSEAYEAERREQGEIRVEEGQLDISQQRLALAQRLRESLTQDKMHEFNNTHEFEEFVTQTAHEMDLKLLIRQNEVVTLRESNAFELGRERVIRQLEIEAMTDDAKRQAAWRDLVAEEQQRDERHRHELERDRDRAVNESDKAKLDLELQQLQHAQDLREAEAGVDLLRKTTAVEQDNADREQDREAMQLEARSKATAEALMSIVDGATGDKIVEMEELRQRERMTPDQLLVLAAQASPDVARALAQKYAAEGQMSSERVEQLQQQLADQRDMADGYADRMERIMQMALGQMGDVAGAKATPAQTSQTVVAGAGGAGRPVVINAGGAVGTCRHCNASLEAGGAFCPDCGKKQ